ncbi:MAG: beta-phosphoglucomutase family hydrolase [Nitrospiraceae bacterium]|jgi:beta-phosphoglucomutase family hydrolase
MSQSHTGNPITRDKFDAVLFDLDGVLTATAKVHAAAWKKIFDEYLRKRATENNEPFQPFDIQNDYKLYVDGKPRYDGARDFLGSRGIHLPEGTPDSPPEDETVCGLGNRKDKIIQRVIESDGVEAYAGSVALVRHLRSQGIKTAVVTSSHHGGPVVEAAGIADLFDLRVDGNDVDRLKLAGKPAPDAYLKAAEDLGVEPKRAVVVEDALSGVQAGRNGGFGLVVGVARYDNADELKANGADMVVTDLGEMLL